MGKYLITKLHEEFVSLLKDPEVTKDYCSFYSSVVNWIKQKKKYFTKEIMERNRLDVLVNLDPNEYIIDEPYIELSTVASSFESNFPDKIDNLAMLIGDTLWDMVTIYSEKDCPVCDDGLRYILAELNYGKKIVLECDTCGWCEYLDGTTWNEGVAMCIPANIKDLIEFGLL